MIPDSIIQAGLARKASVAQPQTEHDRDDCCGMWSPHPPAHPVRQPDLSWRRFVARPDKRDFRDQFLDEQAAKRIEVLGDQDKSTRPSDDVVAVILFEPTRTPPKLMIELSKPITDAEIEAAAAYFSALQPRKRIKVVESDTAPKTYVAGLLWAAVETGAARILKKSSLESTIHARSSDLSLGARQRHSAAARK